MSAADRFEVKKGDGHVCLDMVQGRECVCEERQARVAENRARLARAASDRRMTPFVYQGVDLIVELRKMRALDVFHHMEGIPRMRVKHSASHRYVGWATGRAWTSRFEITIGMDAHLADVLETMLHELTHCSLPDGEHHSESFVRKLVRAARELWGLEFDPEVVRHDRNVPGAIWAYRVDRKLVEMLRQKLEGKEVAPILAKPPKPKPSAEEIALRRAESKARHAAEMLEAHLRRLKREQTLVKKWRRRAGYYDRALAAKRGER